MAPGHGNLDVWQYTVPSGPARPITANGDAYEFLTADGDRIAWVENDPTGPTQDPMRIRTLDLAAGGTPTTPVPGPNEGNPAVGDTFLAYLSSANKVTVTTFTGWVSSRASSADAYRRNDLANHSLMTLRHRGVAAKARGGWKDDRDGWGEAGCG